MNQVIEDFKKKKI